MTNEKVIAISEKRLQEMKQQLIDEAWIDNGDDVDAESVQAYLEDFTEQIIKGGLSNE